MWFLWIQRGRFRGLHARKLGILTLCRLLAEGGAKLPAHVQAVWPHLVPMALLLFENLGIAYEVYDEDSDDDDDDDEDDDEDDEGDEGDEDIHGPDADDLVAALRAAAGREGEDGEGADEKDLERATAVQHLLLYETPSDDMKADPFHTFTTVLQQLSGRPDYAAAASQVRPSAYFFAAMPDPAPQLSAAHCARITEIQGVAARRAAEKAAAAAAAPQ